MRDGADNVVIVCSIENVDPMGVHTGDSVTVAPQQTLTDRQYQKLRDQAIAVIRAVGVETGGSNVQFAVNPATDEIVVIEMNPRVSRSSALASKATGLPDRQDRRAAGGRLPARRDPQRHHARARRRRFEPTLDYVVVKWPRFAFEKFPGVDARLSTHMKSVGEVMAIGRTFQQAFAQGDALARARRPRPTCATATCSTRLETPGRRPLRRDARAARAAARPRRRSTRAPAIDPWFLRELRELALDPEAPFARRAHASRRSTPARPSSRPRRPTTTRPGSGRGRRTRSAAATSRA